MSTLRAQAGALRVLAGLVELERNVRTALIEWPSWAEVGVRDEIDGVRRRVVLGAAPGDAVRALARRWGEQWNTVVSILDATSRAGGSASSGLEAAAKWMEESASSDQQARAATAGARLSAWMVGALPFAFLPLVPVARAPLSDPPGLIVLALGLALGVSGLLWIGRLVPKSPATDDPGASTATLLAGILGGGVSIGDAIRACAGAGPLAGELQAATRRVILGASWPAALALSSSEAVRDLGSALGRSDRLGLPAVESLLLIAERRRRECVIRLDAELRRAPVMMVLPLALCVLPSFLLIGVVPFLRGLVM